MTAAKHVARLGCSVRNLAIFIQRERLPLRHALAFGCLKLSPGRDLFPAIKPTTLGGQKRILFSVVHIGLPLSPPWLTQRDGEKIAARLAGIRQQMREAGFRYDVLHASPDTGLTKFRKRLQADRVDAVVIGGGVVGDPKLASFKQEIVDAALDVAPQAKVLDFDHALEVPVLVRRAFGMQ